MISNCVNNGTSSKAHIPLESQEKKKQRCSQFEQLAQANTFWKRSTGHSTANNLYFLPLNACFFSYKAMVVGGRADEHRVPVGIQSAGSLLPDPFLGVAKGFPETREVWVEVWRRGNNF